MENKKLAYIFLAILSVACIGLIIYGVSNKKSDKKNEVENNEVKEYSVEDLEKFAKEYYEMNVENKENILVSSEKEEESLKIRLYVKENENESDLETYTVDMKTGKGKNSKDEEINLIKEG